MIAFLPDGVVGHDPSTGEEVWHYRVPGGTTGAAVSEQSDSRVIVSLNTPNLLGHEEQRLSLNVLTGEIEEEFSLEKEHPLSDPINRLHHVQGQYVISVVSGDNGNVIEARRVDTNVLVWSYGLASRCGPRTLREGEEYMVGTGHEQVLISLTCKGQSTVISLGVENGSENWSRTWESPPQKTAFPSVYVGNASALSPDNVLTQGLKGDLSGTYSLLSGPSGEDVDIDSSDISLFSSLSLPVEPGAKTAPDHIVIDYPQNLSDEFQVRSLRILVEEGKLEESVFTEVLVEGKEGQRFPYGVSEWGVDAFHMQAEIDHILEAQGLA
nr:PQQ-binding-like beta-propeller repeat protein [Nocardiopsis sinuspersici]